MTTPAHGFHKILVGVDAEGRSDHAAHAGLELARRSAGAEVELVHAVEVPPVLWIGVDREQLAGLHAQTLAHAAERLRARLERAERELHLAPEALTARLRVLPGRPAPLLHERAQETGADLVVLGRPAHRGLRALGSTSRALLHAGAAALWVQPRAWRPIHRILCPVDLSEASIAALARTRDLARALRASVEVLHVFVPPEEAYGRDWMASVGWPASVVDELRSGERAAFEQAMSELDWGGVAHEERFEEGSAEAAILERAGAADLVALSTHGRTGFSAFLLGNVAHAVIRAAEVPVLALRAPA